MMKRSLAVVLLLGALGVFVKLAWKGPAAPGGPGSGPVAAAVERAAGTSDLSSADADAALRARYPDDRPLVDRLLRDYHHNALAIEQTDGLRGLVLLDRLGLEAVFLYEKYPKEFRRLRDSLGDDRAAADLLLHWREYFALKRADDLDRGLLVAEIVGLKPATRRLAARYPSALPLILTEPVGMTELIHGLEDRPEDLRDTLALLDFISLEGGASDLRAALRVLDEHGDRALDAFRLQGLEGFALVKLYGPVFEALGPVPALDDALVLLRVNADDLDRMLRTQPADQVATRVRHIATSGLLPAAAGTPHGLRLVAEFGPLGDRALAKAGADAADVVYGELPDDAMLRGQAVAAMAEHGAMAVSLIYKYGADADFRAILGQYGPRVIPPVAQADAMPEALAALRAKDQRSVSEALAMRVLAVSGENGQATIRQIRGDGIERVESLSDGGVEFYQFLPLYDLLHLGRVLGRGHAPTTGEMAWAAIDAGFVVLDALSLTALQPEGAAAVEAVRSQVKTAGRTAAKTAGRELTGESAEAGMRAAARTAVNTERLSRWWAVRAAGGTYEVLRRMPEALGRLTVPEIARMGRPLCTRAGLQLSRFAPVRFVRNGVAVLSAIPPQRGWKYLTIQGAQAGVGVVAVHKMEEHLASRRPAGAAP